MKAILMALAVSLPGTVAGAQDAFETGVVWRWTGYQSDFERVEILQPDSYSLTFEPGGKVVLQAGCNRGAGTFVPGEAGAITFGPVALTRMFCNDGGLADRFVAGLAQATAVGIRDGGLVMTLGQAPREMRFTR
jgi:heat shock protein HslJ